MPTNAQQVKQYLDFALVQLAAESYWHGVDLQALATGNVLEISKATRRLKYGFNDPIHPFIKSRAGVTGDADTAAETATTGSNSPVLPGYNRMVEDQADDVLQQYKIIDHHANDATGFAATLFRRTVNDPITGAKEGEYVLSFRSLESRPWKVAGDAERDNDGVHTRGQTTDIFATQAARR